MLWLMPWVLSPFHHENAAMLPSGEKVTNAAYPPSVVSGTTCIGGATDEDWRGVNEIASDAKASTSKLPAVNHTNWRGDPGAVGLRGWRTAGASVAAGFDWSNVTGETNR